MNLSFKERGCTLKTRVSLKLIPASKLNFKQTKIDYQFNIQLYYKKTLEKYFASKY